MRADHPSRRSFLRQAVGTVGLLPGAAVALGECSRVLASAAGKGEDYWALVRQQFSFSERKIPMNAANLCPSPSVVAERVTELTRDIDGDCSFQNRGKFDGLLEASRQKVAQQLGVTADEIALVRNTSEANNTINNGLSLKAGDEVVIWDQNHPTNHVAWEVRAARYQLVVKRVSTPGNPTDLAQLVDVFTKAFSPRTRVLALTHVSNVSGLRLPVRELGEIAHRRGIHVHVDGAQTWGALQVNLREIGCDSYAASAHKWLMGPKEVGLLYVKKERLADIWPNVVAPGWGNNVEPAVKGARKFESLGQRDDAALAAIGTTLDFHRLLGAERIESRLQELASALKTGLRELGAEVVTPLAPDLSAGVCIIAVPAKKRTELFNKLYEAHGIAGAATGGLRLCPHIYNTLEHVERAVQGVKALRSLLS